MLTAIALFLLAACGEPDPFTPTPDDTGTGDGGTAYDGGTEDGGTPDGGTDTGTEPVGGNCGGPEPPLDSLWECEGIGEGSPWTVAGPPEDLENCLTGVGWEYWLTPDGMAVTLIRDTDGKEFFCDWDGESYIE